MSAYRHWTRTGSAIADATRVFLKDTGHGLLEVSHNSLALLGLAVAAIVLFVGAHPELRRGAEQKALGWLLARQEARLETDPNVLLALAEPEAIARATAVNPADLSRQQASVAHWLSRRYKVAPEPIGRLVQEAWGVGQRAGLDPTLILAVMAIESGFNPFAQSPVGAQGLMQVMTRVHDDKYQGFGGNHAAFDPVTNLRVGVQVLKECIARAGSLEGGLKYYVGAANLEDDGGYAGKVLAEQAHLQQVAAGRLVPATAPLRAAPVQAAAASDAAATDRPSSIPAVTPAKEDTRAQEQIALLR
jgi:hypothetical protein